MNKLIVSALVVAAAAVPALSQGPITTVTNGAYTYQFRIVADGDGNAPSGSWAQFPGYQLGSTNQIGFWIQARVLQSTGQNFGIGRASAPGTPDDSFITVSDSAASTVLNRGFTSAAVTGTTAHTGRGAGYTSGGRRSGTYRWITTGPANSDADHTSLPHIISQDTAAGNNGNNASDRATEGALNPAAFPGVTNAENGAFDSSNHRIYGFDAYVGGTRSGLSDLSDPENPITNIQPWNVNGTAGVSNGGNGASPIPSDGTTYSPWASLYRFVIVVPDLSTQRSVTLNAHALLNGTIQSAETSFGSGSWALQLAPGTPVSASYTLPVPTPGAASLMGVGLLAAARRRRV